MEELHEKMKEVLADSFAFYLKAHYFHWNVEGPNFVQYHDFFGELYNEVWSAVDSIAEHIRAINAYAPGSFTRYMTLTSIEDEVNIPSPMSMITKLLDDNNKVISCLRAAYTEAEKAGELGLANFLQDRMDIHAKHGWMLRALSKA